MGIQKANDARYAAATYVPSALMLGVQLKKIQLGIQGLGAVVPSKYYVINPNNSDISVKESIRETAIGPYLRLSTHAQNGERAAGFFTIGANYCLSSRTAFALNTSDFKLKESFQNTIATSADIGFSIPLLKHKLLLTTQYQIIASRKKMYKYEVEIENFLLFNHSLQIGLACFFKKEDKTKKVLPSSSKFE